MKAQLFSGSRGKITMKKDGVETTLAFVTDVSISENAGLRPTYVVGSLNPVGIEPLSLDVSCSVGRIIPISTASGNPAAQSKITAIDHGLEPVINQILAMDDLEINIYDKALSADGTDRIIASVKYARFAGRSTSLSSGDVGSERFNFVGILDAGDGGDSNAADELGYGLD